MRISEEGIDFIKGYETLELVAYLCPAKVWTIGYGHTKGVQEGDTCTEEEAEQWLDEDLDEAETAVNDFVDVELTQSQFDALVSFTFNCGVGALRGSTLLKLLNQERYAEAEQQFHRWNRSGGKVLPGLTRRRAAEAEMFGAEG